MIYSGSVMKLLFALLHSPIIQLESSLYFVNNLLLCGENRTTSLAIFSDTKLGDGNATRFWFDKWIDDKSLLETFPRLFALELDKEIMVADKMKAVLDLSFRRHVRNGAEHQQLEELYTLMDSVSLSQSKDRWVFDLLGDGIFRIKYIPIKINVFAWCARRDYLPTRANLNRRGIILESSMCPLCHSEEEDINHVLFRCDLAKVIVHRICRWWELDWHDINSFSDWFGWFSLIRLPAKRIKAMKEELHPGGERAKVTAIEESKDLTSLSLNKLIGNLNVHEMIIKKDFKIVKEKGERKSLALNAKKESSDEECSTFKSEDEDYAMAVRDFKKFFKRRDCPKPPKDNNQRAFFGGSWSDSGEEDDEKVNNETCLVAQASSEICLGVDLEPNEWIKDSECSKHMTGNQKLFSSYKAYNGSNIIFGSNLRGNIIGKGTILNDYLKIDNVEHVGNLRFNLLSIRQICDNKYRVTLSEHESEITKDGKVIGRGIKKKGLYVMKLRNKPKDKICLATIDKNSTLWHRRLGYANMRLIQSLASKKLVRNLPKLKFDQYFSDACKIRKEAHTSHKAKNIVSTTRCLELLHIDLFGSSFVRSYGGNRYTLVIVDDYYRAILGKTPYELLRGRKPTLDYFIEFGSKCFILNTKYYLTKFDPMSYEGVLLGYSQNSKAYIILNKHTRKIKESLNVTFDETPPPSMTSPLVDDDLDEEEVIKITEKKNLEKDIEDETLEIDEIVNIKESWNHPLQDVIGNLNQRTIRSQAQNQSHFFCFISTIEHKNVNEALGDESWIVVMQEELNQFIANEVGS
uniref:RNA-directed DNA polymerase, eukaryota n=1 Tax=Tanacetum cinerariifolium TaxID=118510 RepID=A0A699GR28_TANCI|nr:RNA-directed DNA polymerase, eukaryota [Tanacetum cinerariifolium]